MNTLALVDTIYPYLINYALVFIRIFALFYTFSLFRREMATLKVIISLCFILSYYVIMLYPDQRLTIDIASISFLLKGVEQFLIGFVVGLILNLIIEVFTGIGQIISSQVGLGAASLFDPKFGMITSLTNFYVNTVMLLFLKLNGHLIVIDMLVQSFRVLPVHMLVNQIYGNVVFGYAKLIFVGSVTVSLTVITAILMINITLAMISKFSPQFNLFSIGLNVSIMVGLICIYLSFQMIVDKGDGIIDTVLGYSKSYITLLVKHE